MRKEIYRYFLTMANNSTIDFEDKRDPTKIMELFATKTFYRGSDNAFSTKHIVNMRWEVVKREKQQ